MRSAVVLLADSYGGSMSAIVKLFPLAMSSSLRSMPNDFDAGRKQKLDQTVDLRDADSIGRFRDGTLAQRKAVREHCDAGLRNVTQRRRMVRARPRHEHAV